MIRPILFSGPMVRALLDGRKTQTRRILNMPPYDFDAIFCDDGIWYIGDAFTGRREHKLPVRYRVGDRLYVREAWHAARSLDNTRPRDIPRDAGIEYAATARSYAEIGLKGKLRPSMFLPRWASRLTLFMTDVRVQRLQEISEADAIAEGAEVSRLPGPDGGLMVATGNPGVYVTPYRWYRQLWDSLNAERGFGWDVNPWIVAVSFTVHRQNIDMSIELANGPRREEVR
mgnify:CR=1 FL=1